MTKKDLKNNFGSLSAAAKAATEAGKPITVQAISQWPDGEIDVLWSAFFYLIQKKNHELNYEQR